MPRVPQAQPFVKFPKEGLVMHVKSPPYLVVRRHGMGELQSVRLDIGPLAQAASVERHGYIINAQWYRCVQARGYMYANAQGAVMFCPGMRRHKGLGPWVHMSMVVLCKTPKFVHVNALGA